ncbi:spermidine/putrescine ABC transporter substrate-binding protein [Mycolicibacterium phlei]|jgi:spermidine/putrescine transport system substrate-binding protein|uniref:Twin-arginine translocation pathway signal protein n=1 Tax=Mycolicibacterium phlei DSM 43239 = CCUG 21000 TaxID=1226750 RepID=A0A5N5UXL3_MYCPH|nr:spermidine/putrescine ABC transporter substrate-binding protein [Mycolicibacterium phlei]VEG09574.1 extracellular solute-binding protein [Mycobacteroides chelonae]AMO61461.1 Spermidine/putrescine-binding periplasmic protein precursor [Mycolicibacterium phlei]EID12060.1 spermidine/putrescine-binding periplasmic protein [Mycolicibacterium phlei RIVM601174]KAB7754351.1 twin-arginine translocation pathway signal protein [Mycolicibacterium phlei DSM 43239 = CCUG 21000]KXW63945.1 twin-arginine tr
MSNLDPRLARFAANRTSRRRFLGGSAAAAAALALGPSLLAACGSDSSPAGDTSTEGGPASGTLRVSNWPLYMADGFIAAFQQATGITVDYKEDFNDNEQWFAKVKEPLARKQDIGADLVNPTSFMASQVHGLGWLNDFTPDGIPNKKNLREDLLNAQMDPGRKWSAPYMAGMVGVAYNRAATGREITTIEDLWAPEFKGRVSLFTDFQDGLGMIMQSLGGDPAAPTLESVQKAIDVVAEQKAKGQIRRFTGNDYADDLAAGNIVIAQAYSGDVVQLQADNPDLQFVVPESGCTDFLDTMVIPYTTQNQKAAEAFIDYIYDRENYAKLVAYTQFVPVLSDMTEALDKLDPELAKNELINPSPETLARVKAWAPLEDEQKQEYATLYAAVTGG